MTQSLARAESTQNLDSLRKLIYKLQGATDIETISSLISQHIQINLGYPFVWMGLYDSGAEKLEGPWKLAGTEKSQIKAIPILPGDLFDQVLLTRQPATVPNLQSESRVGPWQNIAKKIELQGAVLQPLRFQKESLGVLLIGTPKWGVNPRQEESEELSILGHTIGTTLKLMEAKERETPSSLHLPDYDDQPLVDLLTLIAHCQSWEDQLTTIAHELINAHPNISSGLYLLDPDSGDFESYHMHKTQDTKGHRSKTLTHVLPYQQNRSFFRTVERQNGLAISDVEGVVGASVPSPLISFFQARSLLIQPIMVRQSLKGIWVISQTEAFNWGDVEKRTLALMSKLVELTYPKVFSSGHTDNFESEPESDNLVPLPVAQSTPEEWSHGVHQWFVALAKKFQCQWSILLSYDEDTQEFFPSQIFSTNRRTKIDKSTAFEALSKVDEKLVTKSDQGIALTDLQEDLRLVAWRDQLLAEGMQSILLTRLTPGKKLTEVLLLGNTTARTWSNEEAQELTHYGHQYYQAQDRRKKHQQMLTDQNLNIIFREGLQTLQSTKSTQTFVEEAAKILVNLMNASGCLILLKSPQRKFMKVKARLSNGSNRIDAKFGQKVNLDDPLLRNICQIAQAKENNLAPLIQTSADLSSQTLEWLTLEGEEPLLGIPLQPQPKQSIFGVLILLKPDAANCSAIEQETLSDFARYMAWVLSSTHVTDVWRRDYENLHLLHWYQNKTLGQSCEGVLEHLEKIFQNPSPGIIQDSAAHINSLVKVSYDQNAQLIPELDLNIESISLVRFLREIIDRLEPIFSTKQVWVQVHHLKQSNIALKNSKQHLTFIFDEVLKAATVRSEAGGRIDIWCRMNHPQWLEISVTDDGKFDPRFLRDLHLGHQRDRLKPSLVTEDLGHRLLACKSLTQKLGGKLDVMALEDGRTLTRFTLPCEAQ